MWVWRRASRQRDPPLRWCGLQRRVSSPMLGAAAHAAGRMALPRGEQPAPAPPSLSPHSDSKRPQPERQSVDGCDIMRYARAARRIAHPAEPRPNAGRRAPVRELAASCLDPRATSHDLICCVTLLSLAPRISHGRALLPRRCPRAAAQQTDLPAAAARRVVWACVRALLADGCLTQGERSALGGRRSGRSH